MNEIFKLWREYTQYVNECNELKIIESQDRSLRAGELLHNITPIEPTTEGFLTWGAGRNNS